MDNALKNVTRFKAIMYEFSKGEDIEIRRYLYSNSGPSAQLLIFQWLSINVAVWQPLKASEQHTTDLKIFHMTSKVKIFPLHWSLNLYTITCNKMSFAKSRALYPPFALVSSDIFAAQAIAYDVSILEIHMHEYLMVQWTTWGMSEYKDTVLPI